MFLQRLFFLKKVIFYKIKVFTKTMHRDIMISVRFPKILQVMTCYNNLMKKITIYQWR